MMSRRSLPLLALVVLLLAAGCEGRRNAFTLKGDIDTLGDDTVYICGNNEYFDRLVPVPVRHGRFRFTFRPDTITPLWVLFSNGHHEFIFAEKRTETFITGDTAAAGHLTVSGGEQNDLLAAFEAMLRDTVLLDIDIQHQADTFIMRHPFDDASVWILQKYFVDVPSPEVTFIRSSIGKMSGNLQDNSYVSELRTRLGAYRKRSIGNIVGNYLVNDTTGRRISTAQLEDSCVLITFWASWDEESRERQREYRALADTFAGQPITLLSVSLDTDRDTWLKAINEDSVPGLHASNLTGWNTELVRLLSVTDIPSNALLNPLRRVQAYDLYGEELKERINKLLIEEKIRKEQEEKAAKEREKELKKNKLKNQSRKR
jgi:hypothetical protein